ASIGTSPSDSSVRAWISSFPKTSERLAASLLKEYLTRYLAHLTAQRYPPKTMQKYAAYLLCFGEFVCQRGPLDVTQLSLAVAPFLAQLASKLPSAAQVKPILDCFIRYFRQTRVIPAPEPVAPPYPDAERVEAYCTTLRNLRALKDRTVRHIRGTCQ